MKKRIAHSLNPQYSDANSFKFQITYTAGHSTPKEVTVLKLSQTNPKGGFSPRKNPLRLPPAISRLNFTKRSALAQAAGARTTSDLTTLLQPYPKPLPDVTSLPGLKTPASKDQNEGEQSLTALLQPHAKPLPDATPLPAPKTPERRPTPHNGISPQILSIPPHQTPPRLKRPSKDRITPDVIGADIKSASGKIITEFDGCTVTDDTLIIFEDKDGSKAGTLFTPDTPSHYQPVPHDSPLQLIGETVIKKIRAATQLLHPDPQERASLLYTTQNKGLLVRSQEDTKKLLRAIQQINKLIGTGIMPKIVIIYRIETQGFSGAQREQSAKNAYMLLGEQIQEKISQTPNFSPMDLDISLTIKYCSLPEYTFEPSVNMTKVKQLLAPPPQKLADILKQHKSLSQALKEFDSSSNQDMTRYEMQCKKNQLGATILLKVKRAKEPLLQKQLNDNDNKIVTRFYGELTDNTDFNTIFDVLSKVNDFPRCLDRLLYS